MLKYLKIVKTVIRYPTHLQAFVAKSSLLYCVFFRLQPETKTLTRTTKP